MSRWLPEGFRKPRTVWGADAAGLAWHEHGRAREALFSEDAAAHAARAMRGAAVDVIAANELAVHWLQAPPSATRSLQELRLVAQARCAHLHGGRPEDWWVAGDWSVRAPFVCAALPRGIVQLVHEACQPHAITPRWHTGWSVLASGRAAAIADEGWSGMRTPQRALLWRCHRGQVAAMTSLALDPECDESQLQQRTAVHLRLEAAGSAQPQGEHVHWIDADGPAKSGSPAGAALSLAQWLTGGTA